MQNSSYLLDTNHCSHIINGNSVLINKLDKEQDSTFCISSTIAGELYYMVYKSRDKENNLANISSFIKDVNLILVDTNIANTYGELKAKLVSYFGPKDKNKQRGLTASSLGFKENDLWIAAAAIQKSLILLTSDGDFTRIKEVVDLKIENWIQ